jgi:hypothetical protein
MPDIIGDPAFVCLGLASTEDGLIVISLRLRFLSCWGVTGNSLFPGSAVKYLENISHSFSSPELLMCTPEDIYITDHEFWKTITATQAISKIKQTFPKSQVAVCSIHPRKGRGQHLIKMNGTSNHVNGFLNKMCIRDGTLDFIDIHKEFSKQGSAIKPHKHKFTKHW